MSRPCPCDRYTPGGPFVRGRDCPACHLWHNEPTHPVVRAWRGEPAIAAAQPVAVRPCVHLSNDPVPARQLVALGLSPIRDWRVCGQGRGPQGLTCPCLSTCGPGKCPDYRASDGPAVG